MRCLFRMGCGCLALVFLCAGACPTQAAERSASFLAAMNSITTDEVREHVAYLADDAREGRQPGTRGGREASDYLVKAFQEIGLRPAGTDGGFLQSFPPNYRNVLAWIEGSDPELSKEYVLVGGHFDHVGRGSPRNSRGGIGQIHNGADDNASGTAAILELAEAVTLLPQTPRRSILFALWDAEEMGLLGSKFWAGQPTVPIERVVATVHLDMIGRLRDNRVEVFGVRTGTGLRRLLSLQNDASNFTLNFSWGIPPNSDHHSLFGKGVPAILIHTGLHDDYHTPRDDADRVDNDGVRRIDQWAFRVVTELANGDTPPLLRAQAAGEPPLAYGAADPQLDRLGMRLSVQWPDAEEQDTEAGVVVSQVVPDSSANRAGLRVGDRIMEFDHRGVFSGRELRRTVLRAASPADAVVQRDGESEPIRLSIPLEGQPIRVGITWQTDESEPGTVVISHVIPASPADEAGLHPGDRIYRVDGKEFSSDSVFAETVRGSAGPLEFQVEREGKVSNVRLYLTPEQAEEELRKKSA